jgi:nickel transport system ATP-binding protein
MSELVIQIDNLTKTYRSGLRRSQVFAVRNLSLGVKKGSIVAFVGPNGAGKTTTIHSLLGFLKPDRGTIELFGQPIGSASLRARVGYQCEIFHTYPSSVGAVCDRPQSSAQKTAGGHRPPLQRCSYPSVCSHAG